MTNDDIASALQEHRELLDMILDRLIVLTPDYAAESLSHEERQKQDKQDKDYERFKGRNVNEVCVARTFDGLDQKLRFMTANISSTHHSEHPNMDQNYETKAETDLRERSMHVEVKALVRADETGLEEFIIQRWDKRRDETTKQSFKFDAEETETLFKFLATAMYLKTTDTQTHFETIDDLFEALML